MGYWEFTSGGREYHVHEKAGHILICKSVSADWHHTLAAGLNGFLWGDPDGFNPVKEITRAPLVVQAQCVSETVGAMELASWAGALPIEKRAHGLFVLGARGASEGAAASENTTVLNYYSRMVGRKLFGRRVRLPFRLFGTKSPYTLAGRANVLLARGLVAYDAVKVANCETRKSTGEGLF